jgi:D-glycero-beta-D-manno-heptose-7-phosphate kinase
MSAKPAPARLLRLLARLGRGRVLVIGDLMLDHFIWGRVDRISPEAPVPVVRVTHESIHLGGAANVVHNLRALGGQVVACGVIGRDAAGRQVLEELRRLGAHTDGIAVSRSGTTIRKTRVVAHSQQVVRFDHESEDHGRATARRLLEFVAGHAADFDAVVVSDYGKGVISPELLEGLRLARERRPFRLIVDPKKANFNNYHGMTLATPNLSEAAEAADVDVRDERGVRAAGERLLEKWQAEAVLITRGEHGMSLFARGSRPRHFPTVARQVFDVTGAGDTVIATCALSLAVGARLEEAALLANHAAGIVVGKVGTASASVAELRAELAPARAKKGRGPMTREKKG